MYVRHSCSIPRLPATASQSARCSAPALRWEVSLCCLPQGHLETVARVRWPYAVADDFFVKQLPMNVTWLLTLLYSLVQTGAL